MAMSDAFSEAGLSLKQVDPSDVGELGRYALGTALLTYGLADDAEIERGKAEVAHLFESAEVEVDPTRARRFAGDSTLPRSRYYSVVDDDLDSDHGTLFQEMSAYLVESDYPGLVSFFDSAGANTTELLGVLAEIPKANRRALDLSEPSLLIALRPLLADPVLREAYGEGRHYVVRVPYRVSSQVIDHVIDLRRPAARNWLVEQFRRPFEFGGTEWSVLFEREPPDGFSQILPGLLDQWLGGGRSTANLVGFFARKAGAGGLVYPSARSNASVEVEEGEVTSSSGWCFVRYAGAPPMEVSHSFSQASDPWPATAGFSPQVASWVETFIPVNGVEIQHEESGSGAGSFFVTGLAEYNLAVYRLAQATAVLPSIDNELGPVVRSRLFIMALHNAPDDIARIAVHLLGGLLGSARSVAALESVMASAGPGNVRETLAGALELIAAAPAGFRASATLLEAWGLS